MVRTHSLSAAFTDAFYLNNFSASAVSDGIPRPFAERAGPIAHGPSPKLSPRPWRHLVRRRWTPQNNRNRVYFICHWPSRQLRVKLPREIHPCFHL